MVLELGLRFRPTGGENQEEYAAAVTLLAQDVSHLAPILLDKAIMEWVRTKRFLPRAAELIDMARQIERDDALANSDAGVRQLQEHCDRMNAFGWVQASGNPFVVMGSAPSRRIGRASDRVAAA